MQIKGNSKIDFILNNYSQIDIFAKIFNVTREDIEYCLEHTSNKIHNLLRGDMNPSLGFMYRSDGRLISKDWANDNFTGDIFDVLATVKGLDVRKDFVKLCNFIIDNNSTSLNPNKAIINNIKNKEFTIIKYEIKQFDDNDIKYFTKGGISLNILNIRNVFAAKYIWVNNMHEPVYVYNKYKPAYIYSFGLENRKEIVKIYNPKADDKKYKFITNNKLVFEAPHELYDADVLIITKSRKDKLVIESLLQGVEETLGNMPLCNIGSPVTYCVTSFNSEKYRLTSRLVEYLRVHYKKIIINVDFDKTGIMNAFYHNILYNIDCVFLGNNSNIYDEFNNKELIRYFASINKIKKDVTLVNEMLEYFIDINKNSFEDKDLFDYVSNNGINKGKKLINKMFKYE